MDRFEYNNYSQDNTDPERQMFHFISYKLMQAFNF